MKRLLCLVVSFVLCAGFVSAQSLVELAKKEKERRKKNVDQSQQATEYSGAGGDSANPDTPPDEAIKANENDDWDNLMRRYQSRYDSQKSYLQSQESNLKQCKKQQSEYRDRQRERDKANAIRSGTSWVETEKRREKQQYWNGYSCDWYEKSMADTKRKMQDISNEVANEARKRRILPGNARLRK